jgi:putative ABC transport system ATP-binding protein
MEISNPIIEVCNLSKSFVVGEQTVDVLKDISLDIENGDFMIIFGPSGSGKSTLLYSILGLERPTEGNIFFLGEDMYAGKTEDDITNFRRKHIGMIYQQSNWVQSLSVLENVALPLRLLGIPKGQREESALKVLKKVGMEAWANYNPAELSSGQQQKVAVARALVTDPEVIIADEPTGNLDYESGKHLLHLLGDLRYMGKTIVMVTHDLEYLQYARNTIKMRDGRIEETYCDEDKRALVRQVPLKKKSQNSIEKSYAN